LKPGWFAVLVAFACSSSDTSPGPQPRLTSGIRTVYVVEGGSDEAAERTVRAMRTRLDRLGVSPSRVVARGGGRLEVEIPPLPPDRIELVRTVLARPAILEVAIEGSPRFVELGDLADAAAVKDPHTGEAMVRVKLRPAAAARFAQVTGENVGRRLIIAIDGAVVSTPIVAGRIDGGFFDVTSQGPAAEVAVLAAALPAPLPGRVLVESVSRIGEP